MGVCGGTKSRNAKCTVTQAFLHQHEVQVLRDIAWHLTRTLVDILCDSTDSYRDRAVIVEKNNKKIIRG